MEIHMKKTIFVLAVLLSVRAVSIHANTILFEASLDGPQDATASPAIGFGSVVLDDVAHTITVNESWTGLSAPATASHIHGPAAPGSNAAVIFPFSNVPSVISGSIPQQSFSISDAQIAQLEAGLDYFNVHSSLFPGGEIRGQIRAVPDSGAGMAGLLTLGFLCCLTVPRNAAARR